MTVLDTDCRQRVPFAVAFHPDGSLTSYSEMLMGVSEHSASPHFGDLSSTELGHHHPFLSQVLCRAI